MKMFIAWSCFSILLTGCTGSAHLDSAQAAHEAYVAQVQATAAVDDSLMNAAWRTHAAYNRAVGAGEIEPSENIPSLYWADRIKDLNPIRVYTHRVNIVVVQQMSGNVEKGKYIYIPISSYMPMSGEDGFAFSPDPLQGNQYHSAESLDYTRTITYAFDELRSLECINKEAF